MGENFFYICKMEHATVALLGLLFLNFPHSFFTFFRCFSFQLQTGDSIRGFVCSLVHQSVGSLVQWSVMIELISSPDLSDFFSAGQSGPLPSILAGPTEKQQERVVSDTRLKRHMLKPDRPDLRPERYDGGRGTNKH